MLVWDTSREQWKTLQQQEGCKCRALTELGQPERWRPSRQPVVKPEIEVTIGGDRPSRFGGDVVTFEDICESFIVAYSEYEQQMRITNQDGGDQVPARRRALVDLATQMMVADEFYDGKPWVDFSEEEKLMQGLERFAGVDMHETSDEDF